MQENDRLSSVVRLAFRLGCTAFGGPAAHIAMLRDEAVERRKWLSDQHFLDLIGLTNLIPGPNSTEMVMHVGHERAGWRGLVGAGTAFILPAAAITLAFSWAYVEYGATAPGEWILRGIKPVVLAVIVQAIWGLGRTAIKGPWFAAVGALIVALYLLGINEIALLFGGAALAAGGQWLTSTWQARGSGTSASSLLLLGLPGLLPATQAVADPTVSYSLGRMFLAFLKIGSVLYGSGYVLLAFLQNEFVDDLGWLTEQQLLDAVAIGQVTPGPVFTTATFVGYIAGGFPGAVVATLAIFIPAFLFVGLLRPVLPRLQAIPWVRPLLDGVNIAAIGLMVAVSVLLTADAVVDVMTAVIAVVAFVLLVRFRVNSAVLIVAGAVVGGLSTQI